MRKMKIIISGGGTGGHIYPAIAIANSLKNKYINTEILFIGAKGKMEMEKVPDAGYKIEGLWISGLQRKLTIKNILFPLKVIYSLYKAKKIIRNFKPNVVIGVGGYASGPTLRAAINFNIPTLIQEQNSYPGITNKILSKKVDKICVAYEGMEKYFPPEKICLTGNPVRQDITSEEISIDKAMNFFNLNNKMKTLLVIGGSLGARTINQSISNILHIFGSLNIQVLWQTGKYYYETAKKEIEKNNFTNIHVFEFINKMEFAYKVADFVISRAGAIAISELCIVAKPVILIPSPNVAEDHQTKNALALVKNKAAILVRDDDAFTKLKENLEKLIYDVDLQNVLSENMKKIAYNNAADKIAEIAISLNNLNVNK